MNKILLSIESIFEYINGSIQVDIGKVILAIVMSLGLGVAMSLVYIFTHRKSGFLASMPTTLIILPVIITIVIMLVGTNFASAFALAGVFTLIRFRSEPGDPKDLSYIFGTVAIGLCCGMGFVYYAAVLAALLIGILLVIYFLHYGEPKKSDLKLKILVPEDLNYEHAFDEVFTKYNVKAYLDKVRTADFGTVFELVYRIRVEKDFMQKAFIDDLRCRNGNLNIVLTLTDNFYTKNA